MTYELLTDPGRLRAALRSVLVLASYLELDELLDTVMTQACEITEARGGALRPLGPGTDGVEHFFHFRSVGLSDAEAQELLTLLATRDERSRFAPGDRQMSLVEASFHPGVIEMRTREGEVRTVLAAPIRVGAQLVGHLCLAGKAAGDQFSDDDIAAVDAIIVAGGIAIANSLRVAKGADAAPHRDQIARELHDTVIQRLYGIGVALQGSLNLVADDRLRSRVQRAVDDLDDTIAHVRATIVELGNLPL